MPTDEREAYEALLAWGRARATKAAAMTAWNTVDCSTPTPEFEAKRGAAQDADIDEGCARKRLAVLADRLASAPVAPAAEVPAATICDCDDAGHAPAGTFACPICGSGSPHSHAVITADPSPAYRCTCGAGSIDPTCPFESHARSAAPACHGTGAAAKGSK